jgi:hypothetical protein
VTPPARFDVLIHAPLYGALRALASDARARFRRLVDRLRAGHWGGGTRVKKLRGCAKPVFEARQDAGDRVLFTLASTAARDGSATLQPHLMLWDLVSHDRVTGRARRINPSAEAEFLDFEELEAEEVTEPPPHPAASFRDVAALAEDAEAGVVELMLASDGSAPRPHEEITGGVRWYVVPDRLLVDEARWQELMDSGAEELELKLTAEQYRVVRAPGPVLLSGSAGSRGGARPLRHLQHLAPGPCPPSLSRPARVPGGHRVRDARLPHGPGTVPQADRGDGGAARGHGGLP